MRKNDIDKIERLSPLPGPPHEGEGICWEGIGVGAGCFVLFLAFLINPLTVYCAPEILPAEQEASSDKISLDLKNVDIVELLRIISLKTGKTIVPSKEVTGRITVYLSNVAFNDVLDIILLTQSLAVNRKDNVYYVMSEAEYRKNFGRDYIDQRKIQTVKLAYAKPAVILAALGQLKSDVGKIVADESTGTLILIDIPEKLELLNKTIKELDRPLETTIYDLNYIKPADAKTQLTAAMTPGTGEVIIDERSGKAIVSDLPQKMQKMNMLVRELDEASRQVYVEADIVELTLSDKFEHGIDWNKVFDKAIVSGLAIAGHYPAALTAAYQQLSVGTLAADQFTGVLQFLDTYGKTHVISQPRIAVINNEEANIMVGVRQAYVTTTQSQATTTLVTSEAVEFIDVGVKLKIVPKIGADGFITMKLKPEVSSLGTPLTTPLGNQIPIVNTSTAETVVKVKDGSMIMIAGMTRTEDTDTIKGLPGLAKIPFLGAFFSSRSHEKKRTEVIIFLTPHLSSGDAGLRGEEITKIAPNEDLPKNLQDKVIRDKKIDATIYDSELTPQDREAMAAHRQIVRAENRKKAQDAAQEKAERVIEEAKEKAADMTVEEAGKRALKAASIKAAEILKQESEKTANLQKIFSPQEASAGAKEYYQKGLAAKAASNLPEATRNFVMAIQLDNENAAAYNSLGIIYEQEFKFEKAEAMYLKAIAIDPNFCPAYANLALFNENRGDLDSALDYWRKRAAYGDPNDEWTKKAIARVKELEN